MTASTVRQLESADGSITITPPSGRGVVDLSAGGSSSDVARKPEPADRIRFVTTEGDNTHDGLSWGTALLTLQAAVAALGAAGGTIFVGGGNFATAAVIDCDGITGGIAIEGVGNPVSLTGADTPGTTITFTAAAGNLFTYRNTDGFTLRGLRLKYTHAAYAGDLITGSNVGGADPHFPLFDRCVIAGTAAAKAARSLINLNRSIGAVVRGCYLLYADKGIIGRDGDGSVATVYSNVCTIEANEFSHITTAPIWAAGQSWRVVGNTFEPLDSGKAGAYDSDPAAGVGSTYSIGLVWEGNWHGDVGVDGGEWIKNLKTLGGSIAANYFATVGTVGASIVFAATASQGLSIRGNRFDSLDGVDFNHANHLAVLIEANDFQGLGVPVKNINAATVYGMDANNRAVNIDTTLERRGLADAFKPAAVSAETFSRMSMMANGAPLVSGRLHMVAIYLTAGTVVTNITFLAGTQAFVSGATDHQWFALFDAARNKLAVTTDDLSTAWGVNNLKTLALTVPYPVTVSGLYYLGLLVNAAVVPSLNGATQGTGSAIGLAPKINGFADAGLTDPASCPNTAAALTAAAQIPWAYTA